MSTKRKQPPVRPTGKPAVPPCDHCRKPCTKASGIVRTKDGVFCSPKHRDAARALRRAAAEPEPVDVGAVITTALARRDMAPERFVAPPIFTDAGRQIFTAWLSSKSPDTQASYQASAAHFARWLVAHGHAEHRGHPWSMIAQALQVPEDEGNALVAGWITEQLATPARDGGPANKGSIALRCSGVKTLCEVLKGARMIPYVPMFKSRPKKQARSVVAQRRRYEGVSDSFTELVRGLEGLVSKKDAPVEDVRDWAIVVLASELGLRRIEVVRLNVGDVDFKTGHLLVLGKGRDEREPMKLNRGLIKVLRRWLEARATAVGGDGATHRAAPGDTPLFVSLGRGYGARIGDRSTLNYLVKRRAEQFGVTLKPHDLRRIFNTEALRKYGAVGALPLTRHANTATLMLYDLDAGAQLDEHMATTSDAIAQRRKGKRK